MGCNGCPGQQGPAGGGERATRGLDLRGSRPSFDSISAPPPSSLALSSPLHFRWLSPVVVSLPFPLQVVAGLLHCHSKGVWHLDVKPDNILIAAGPSGSAATSPHRRDAATPTAPTDAGADVVKVADFGCACTTQVTAQPCGTHDYACPEALGDLAPGSAAAAW